MPHLYRAERFKALEDVCASISDYGVDEFRFEVMRYNLSLKRLKKGLYASQPEAIDIFDDELDCIAEALLNIIGRDDSKFTTPCLKGALRAQITGSIFTPFWNAANNFLIQTYSVKDSSLKTQKQSVLKLLAILPLLNDIYSVDWHGRAELKQDIVSNLILTLLNPVKMLNSLLTFVEHSANRLLEVGLTAESKTPIPQAFLKGVVGVAATMIRIPLTILQPFSDILPVVVNNLVIQPVKYVKNKVFSPTRHEVDRDDATNLGDGFSMNSDDEPEVPFCRKLHHQEPLIIDPRVSRSRGLGIFDNVSDYSDPEVPFCRKLHHQEPLIIDPRVSRSRGLGIFDNVSDYSDEEELSDDEQKRSGPSNWRL